MFVVQLPAVAGVAEPSDDGSHRPDAPSTPAARQKQPLKILLVEDHESTRRVMRRLLTARSHDVTTTSCVAEAIQAADGQRFDLIISDLGLPDGMGYDIMNRVRQRYGTCGIAISGYGMDADIARSAATAWLDRLGLADRAAAKLEELSHGNQQRAQLAAALLHEPELLVLDEPFAGLDPVAVHTLAEVLRGEAARGAAVLFSSHQLELVEDICEEVAIVDHGRIVATGDVDALKAASRRRRIELRLEGAPPAWLPDVADLELIERRNGALRLLAGRDVDPEQVLSEAERAGRVIGFGYGPPSLAELFLELVAP
jgi:energy-coupling factor transporter ATP-binding protein EcfA2